MSGAVNSTKDFHASVSPIQSKARSVHLIIDRLSFRTWFLLYCSVYSALLIPYWHLRNDFIILQVTVTQLMEFRGCSRETSRNMRCWTLAGKYLANYITFPEVKKKKAWFLFPLTLFNFKLNQKPFVRPLSLWARYNRSTELPHFSFRRSKQPLCCPWVLHWGPWKEKPPLPFFFSPCGQSSVAQRGSEGPTTTVVQPCWQSRQRSVRGEDLVIFHSYSSRQSSSQTSY